MIVMKFGGSSLASPASIRRVAEIVRAQLPRNVAVVVSALGDTTDHLLEILEHATRAESYLGWKQQEELRTYHFCIAEDLLTGERLERIDGHIRQTFRDLHVRMLEVSEGERAVTPELRDCVASLGEQLSSRLVAAVLEESGTPVQHVDATKLLLTDDQFTNAKPRYWETYARIRWAVGRIPSSSVIVLGGFIGATEDGRTTTLGRGGSDLTASIVGAALNAEEIQVWKDVDGMLTWDPKVKNGGYCVKSLSYDEASELAKAGATVLHPETIRPAQRLRIPVVIRNTFRPDAAGTRIGARSATCISPVKSIVCKPNLTVVELRAPTAGAILPDESGAFVEWIAREHRTARLLAMSEKVIYLALERNGREPELAFGNGPCLQAHVRTNQALITLVGHSLKRYDIGLRLSGAFAQRPALMLPQNSESCAVSLVVPQEELNLWTELLQQIFFKELDPAFFTAAEPAGTKKTVQIPEATYVVPEQHDPAFGMTRRLRAF